MRATGVRVKQPIGIEPLEDRRMLAAWTQQAKLITSDLSNLDDLGRYVAIEGDLAVVGAPGDDTAEPTCSSGCNTGSVYVFQRSGSTWTQVAQLTASDATADDRFGSTVAISGNTIVVGAVADDVTIGPTTYADAGSAYVFTRTSPVSTTWLQTAHLFPTQDVAAENILGENFSASLAIDGNTIVVGAPFDILSGATLGSAYVYTGSGGSWTLAPKLRATDGLTGDRFGSAVDVHGNRLVVGAPFDDFGVTPSIVSNAGSSYVFERATSGSPFLQAAKIDAGADISADDNYGSSVAVNGTTILVGSPREDLAAANSGAAYVYVGSGASWPLQQKLSAAAADQNADDQFGFSVDVQGNTAVVGAPQDNAPIGDSGAIYAFDRSGVTWTSNPKITHGDPISDGTGDRLGSAVGIDSGFIVTGAPVHTEGTRTDSGAAYIFVDPNDPPVNIVPGPQTINEGQTLTFSTGGGNAIATSDVDDFGAAVQVTLSASNGTLTLGGASGLAFSVGDGTSDATMTFTGAIVAINAALNGTVFTPTDSDYFGPASVTITTDDLGNTGTPVLPPIDTDVVSITVNPVNDAPSFAAGADETVDEDAGAQTVLGWASSISAGPANESTQVLVFTATNDNNALFAIPPSVDASGTLTYTPAANANGSATVTLVLTDNGGTANGGSDTSAAATFTITVIPVNDAPSFNVSANDTVNEDSGARTVPAWATAISVGPANESSQTPTFTATNDNNGLFAIPPSVDEFGTLTYTPAANANGSATVTLVLTDDGGTANGGSNTSAAATFTITVIPVNDAPSFAAGADETVDEDAGSQTVFGWASSISSGPANESTQVLVFTATNDNNALFSVQPSIDPITGDLTYTPAANANGSAMITLVLSDNGGTANGGDDTADAVTFTITVNPINDAPIANGQTVSVTEDGQVNITLSGSDIETAPANLKFKITSLPASGVLFYAGVPVEVGDTFTGPPTLKYEPASGCDCAASASFTFTVTDRGDPDNAPGDAPKTSAPATVTINITPAVGNGVFTVSGGILRIGGTSGNDIIVVDKNSSNLAVRINSTVTTIPAAGITEIRVWGRAGNDLIEMVDLAIAAMLSGGNGSDILIGGGGHDLIFGGDGNDLISGGAGNDMLIGGDGSDVISGCAGHDVLVAGDVACTFTDDMLRDIAQSWAVDRVNDEGEDDGTLDESALDDNLDLLAGGAGADWFIINCGDWVIDYRPCGANGDVITRI